MLKAIALKGLSSGAVVGFFTSALYLGLVIIFDTLSDQRDFLNLDVVITILLSCLAVIPATWIGAITGMALALLFPIFRHEKISYVITCFSLCILVVIGSLTILNPNWFTNLDTLSHESAAYIFTLNLCILPGMLYSLLGLVTSVYMFNQFRLTELDDEPAENHATST